MALPRKRPLARDLPLSRHRAARIHHRGLAGHVRQLAARVRQEVPGGHHRPGHRNRRRRAPARRRGGARARNPPADAARLRELAAAVRAGTPAEVDRLAHDPELIVLMETYGDRAASTEMRPAVPVYVDRPGARFAAWYEFFPRCAEGKPDSTSTFRDCMGRVDDAAAMGFDVIYFPPIHPIGFTKRKGRNNSTTSEPGEPGSPYAIGGPAGGHKAVEPDAGHAEGFRVAGEERSGPRAWRSRWISPSTARRTILTSRTIRTGSTSGPTARSNTPRTRPSATRTSTRSTSTATIGKRSGRR